MGKLYDLRQGKRYFVALAIGLALLSTLNAVYEIVDGASYVILGVQLFLLIFHILLPLWLLKGYQRRGAYFALLLFTGFFGFYQSGSRMVDLRRDPLTLPPVLTLCYALTFILCAIYLSYSPEIDVFLKEKQQEREQLEEESY